MKPYAIYFPQFYATPTNDAAWGKGFTDWCLVAGANMLDAWPRRAPARGFYDGASADLHRAHATEAAQAGLGGFAVYHYWFYTHQELGAFEQTLLQAGPGAITLPWFLTWANESWTRRWLGDPRTLVDLTPHPTTAQIERHAEHLARCFASPAYLRIDGRPVVFLYLTRTLTGDVAGMLRGARQVLAARGFDPYFIGDEVYWRVTPEQPGPGQPTLTTSPQVPRIEQLDAVTSYILYFSDPAHPALGPTRDSSGYPGTTAIAADQKLLLAEYRAATGGLVPVVPDVAVGFNDRGFRLGTNHPAQPRQWTPQDGPASTLDHFFRCVAAPELDPKLPMVMVTSWDDWNEDTGVEPIRGLPTRRDDSPSGDAYTQGYEYGHEGRSAVGVLRRDVGLLDAARRGPTSPTGRRAASLLMAGC